jgi:Dolichyl-phosphate-mannose-protein mannosyltransferase
VLGSRIGVRAALGCVVALSALGRSLVALAHPTPIYFPDEYIYSSLSRALAATGRPLVRGTSAHFPALVEPLLAAPLWAIGPLTTAYRLVQVENAVLMSLAAVPVYLLARRLELKPGYALFCAAFAVAIPDLGFSSFVVSDPAAYTVALFALYAGLVALQAPSGRAQLAFVALAALAALTRLELVVLAPAFVVAAFVLDRREALSRHRLPLLLFAGAAVVLGALGTASLGYYKDVYRLRPNLEFLRWAALDLLFLSLTAGVALVPGAVTGLLTTRERRDRAFAALAVPFALAVMFEAALYAGGGSDRFKERYLFVLVPLLPLAFGLYLRQGRPHRLATTAIAAALAAGALALPLSGYVKGNGYDDSPLLWCYLELQWLVGSPWASVAVAVCALAGAAVAIRVAYGGWAWAAPACATVLVLALSLGATRFDSTISNQFRRQLVAPSPSWVDAARVGPVAAIETDLAPTPALLEQLFWNGSIDRELLFGSSPSATDTFPTGGLTVLPDGELAAVAGRTVQPLRTAFLFQGFEVSARFGGARRVASFSSFTLWRPAGTPRLETYELGRYWDGWLAPQGGLEAWPGRAVSGVVSFTLSLPRSRPAPVTLRIGSREYRVAPGSSVEVRIPFHGRGPWSAAFTAVSGAGRLPDNRNVSVRSTLPLFTAA